MIHRQTRRSDRWVLKNRTRGDSVMARSLKHVRSRVRDTATARSTDTARGLLEGRRTCPGYPIARLDATRIFVRHVLHSSSSSSGMTNVLSRPGVT